MDLLHDEPLVRLGSFGVVLLAMLAGEKAAPRRALEHPWRRRGRNLAFVVLNTALVRGLAALAPIGAVSAAVLAEERKLGLFHVVEVPLVVATIASVLALDLAIWAQHVAFHKAPLLWRLHQVHHVDLALDATTGVRFHTIEILISLAWKIAVAVALGAPPGAVVIFEALLNATSMFNHGNVRLPGDRFLRWLVVTPDMHRVHHSVVKEEANSNYGFNLPWWDRLLGTYRKEPAAGLDAMTVGLASHREEVTFPKLLKMPFANN